ncbi:hypothetical protein LR48_Vigan05g205100 [Vigna angularis]|nr:uncharacterized protein LOC108333476 isoform X1 [Vigna angularis]XP_017424423.1 uncharacterized protein LOC108333476 isoform X1 [Vigna angularis]XP_017424424.1 uncharacterized protein LOC108333476 isoform X1 [Vigna angularis]KOM44446.1 hypothetical protein LR48_Vigan05g205100 [Vigna angularis]BAT91775.1 hypothetical protein VIGAN_07040000 [Vigna angularis var. angularis]
MSDRDSKKTRLSGGKSDIHLGNTRHKTEQGFHQNNRGDVETGVSSQEKDFSSSLIEITDVPPLSFEYHGWSEEGINLCVDLNSSPSYWANRYRNEVCLSENACGSLRQDLGCLRGCSSQGKGDEIFEDGGLPDLVDPKNDLVEEQGNSKEINLDTHGKNLPSLAEEREVGKIVKGRENSECYRFDESLKKFGDRESKMEHQKKKKHRHSKVQSCTDKPVGMFLRSMKKSVTVRPRRSTRLFSKVLHQLLH